MGKHIRGSIHFHRKQRDGSPVHGSGHLAAGWGGDLAEPGWRKQLWCTCQGVGVGVPGKRDKHLAGSQDTASPASAISLCSCLALRPLPNDNKSQNHTDKSSGSQLGTGPCCWKAVSVEVKCCDLGLHPSSTTHKLRHAASVHCLM